MKERLQFVEHKQGNEEDFVIHREISPESLDILRASIGKDAVVRSTRESWLYVSPLAEEDHAVSETHAFGTLIEVGERGIVLDVKVGEEQFDDKSGSALTGRVELPYRRHQYQLRRYAEVLEIAELAVGNLTFQLGRLGSEEKLKALA